MQLEFALFCEAAEVSDNGAMSVLRGGIDTIFAPTFPARVVRLILVVRVLVEPSECGRRHEITGEIIGPKGRALPVEMKGFFEPQHHPRHPDRKSHMTVSLDYIEVSFPEPGDYQFRIRVNGVQIGEESLEVVQVNPG